MCEEPAASLGGGTIVESTPPILGVWCRVAVTGAGLDAHPTGVAFALRPTNGVT